MPHCRQAECSLQTRPVRIQAFTMDLYQEITLPVQIAPKQLFKTAGITQINSTELYPALHQAGDTGLPMLVVENKLGRAVISIQGAHLMSFQPVGRPEMLWLSPKCVLQAGKPIRGGIPLCLPWFGPSADGKLQHGFGRIMEWSLAAVEACADGASRIVLELAGDASVSALWPHAFRFRLEAVVGTSLKLALSAANLSATAAPFAFAYHTYFARMVSPCITQPKHITASNLRFFNNISAPDVNSKLPGTE